MKVEVDIEAMEDIVVAVLSADLKNLSEDKSFLSEEESQEILSSLRTVLEFYAGQHEAY